MLAFETFLQLLEETPWWTCLLFAYLLIAGWKATRRRSVRINRLFIFPVVFTLGVILKLYGQWDSCSLFFLAMGSVLGWRMVYSWTIYIDRERKILILPPTRSVFSLVLCILLSYYGFSHYYETHASISSVVLLSDLAIASLITGLFIGRTICLWHRYENPA